jgi:hypothetical protein
VSFWSFNIGLALMAGLTLLPIGTLQLLAAIDHGYWYARSAEFMQRPVIDLLVWMRVPGDIVFSVGALTLAWFVLSLWLRPRQEQLNAGSAGPLGGGTSNLPISEKGSHDLPSNERSGSARATKGCGRSIGSSVKQAFPRREDGVVGGTMRH